MRFKAKRLDRNGLCKGCRGLGGDSPITAEPRRRRRPAKTDPGLTTCPNCNGSFAASAEYCPTCFWDPDGESGTELDEWDHYNSKENNRARRRAREIVKRLWLVRGVIALHIALVCLVLVSKLALMGMDHSLERLDWKFAQLPLQLMILIEVYWELKSIHNTSRWQLRIAAAFSSFAALLLFASPLGWILGVVSAVYWKGVLVNHDLDRLRAECPQAFLDGAGEEYNHHKLSRLRRSRGKRTTGPHRFLYITVPLVLATIVCGGVALLRDRVPGPQEIIVEFQAAWNASDTKSVAALSAPGREERWIKRINRQDRNRKWHGVLPSLDRVVEDPRRSDSIWVTYSGADGELRAQFAVFGKEWVLKSLDYRGFD